MVVHDSSPELDKYQMESSVLAGASKRCAQIESNTFALDQAHESMVEPLDPIQW